MQKIRLRDGNEYTPVELRQKVKDIFQRHGLTAPATDLRFLETMLAYSHADLTEIEYTVTRAREKGLTLSDQAIIDNLIGQAELMEILAAQYNMTPVDLTQEKIDYGFAKLMDSFDARKYGALPIRYERDREVVVALITRPDNIIAQDEVPLILSMDRNAIEWKLVNPEGFEEVLKRVYESEEVEAHVENLEFRAESNLDSGAVRVLQRLISDAQTKGASDIHFENWERGQIRVRFRLDGRPKTIEILQPTEAKLIKGVIKGMAELKYDEKRRPQEGSIIRDFGYGKINLRVLTLPAADGEEVSLRLLDNRMAQRDLDDLGLNEKNEAIIDKQLRRARGGEGGMIIVTGATGSGKSTTNYAMIRRLLVVDKNGELRIVTLEEPVEERIVGVTQVPINEKHGVTFADTLIRVLRADPDAIMIGEIRDTKTADVAVEAALTGHLVMTTLHTKSAIGAITRLKEMGVENYLLSDAISMVTAQRLLRQICPRCKTPTLLTSEEAAILDAPEWVQEKVKAGPAAIYHSKEDGCTYCSNTGYRGRIGVHEILEINQEMSAAIGRGESHVVLEEIAERNNFRKLRDDAFEKVLSGVTDIEEYKRMISTSDE